MTIQGNIDQERLAFINARERLLQFFLVHMYSNNTDIYNARNKKNNNIPFPNDVERMKYFIGRFNKYYYDETYEFMVCIPAVDIEHQEDLNDDNVTHAMILNIKNSNQDH